MAWLTPLGVVAMVACSGEPAAKIEDVGVVQIALAQAPPDIQCLEVSAVGTRTASKRFAVTGSGATLEMTGLPLGSVVFSGAAFAEACDTPSTEATWIADAVATTITRGQVAQVTLVMHRNSGRASISVDFCDCDDGACGGLGGQGVCPGGGGSGGAGTGGTMGNGGMGGSSCGAGGTTASCGPHQMRSGGTACTCIVDAACASTGTSCLSSSTLVTCAADADGCLFQSTTATSCPTASVCERVAPASCADPEWAEWPIPPSVSPASYTDGGNGTIADDITRLVWQRSAPTTAMTQPEAVAYCHGLNLGGQDDWRLPSKIELESIVDYGKTAPPRFNDMFAGAGSYYWTTTPAPVNAITVGATIVDFGSGYVVSDQLTSERYVRCVR